MLTLSLRFIMTSRKHHDAVIECYLNVMMTSRFLFLFMYVFEVEMKVGANDFEVNECLLKRTRCALSWRIWHGTTLFSTAIFVGSSDLYRSLRDSECLSWLTAEALHQEGGYSKRRDGGQKDEFVHGVALSPRQVEHGMLNWDDLRRKKGSVPRV